MEQKYNTERDLLNLVIKRQEDQHAELKAWLLTLSTDVRDLQIANGVSQGERLGRKPWILAVVTVLTSVLASSLVKTIGG